jgi:hypothetical protein
MKTKWLGGLAVVVLILSIAGMIASRNIRAEGDAARGSMVYPRYTVVETEGHNLIVTDNKTSTLYFYTIDKDAKIGSELKLRGKVDLKQVGEKTIKPSDVHLRGE